MRTAECKFRGKLATTERAPASVSFPMRLFRDAGGDGVSTSTLGVSSSNGFSAKPFNRKDAKDAAEKLIPRLCAGVCPSAVEVGNFILIIDGRGREKLRVSRVGSNLKAETRNYLLSAF